MLEIQGLCVSYGDVKTVKNVGFSVASGQIVGLVGESGSGKSTIIRSIFGFLGKNGKITRGQIRLKENELTGLSGKEWKKIRGREVSMIFQHPAESMDPSVTVGNQFCETLKVVSGMKKEEALQRASDLLHELYLPDADRILRSYPFELSGGMCQRVAIGMAMANYPQLLLADEPTSALDVTVQEQTIHVMMELRRKYGTAILLVTHNMGVIAHMADMVGVMYHGEMVEWGTRQEILKTPAHPYTRALIGAIPTMDGKLPQAVTVTEKMPFTMLSETHWAGTSSVESDF